MRDVVTELRRYQRLYSGFAAEAIKARQPEVTGSACVTSCYKMLFYRRATTRLEVRTAARTVNLMQQRIRRLVDDRTAFAAAIAHDLGTPITRLHLRAHEIDEAVTRSRMLADLEQMRRMISATLEFARLEFSAEPLEPIDLASLVQSLCDDCSDAGQQVIVQDLEPATIASKPIALRRALGNLLENAFKYGARARVTLATTPRDVRITIQDDGPGIPQDMVEEAFRTFHRLPQSNGSVDGTGLGLSIARSIVRGLGGEIARRPDPPKQGVCAWHT